MVYFYKNCYRYLNYNSSNEINKRSATRNQRQQSQKNDTKRVTAPELENTL